MKHIFTFKLTLVVLLLMLCCAVEAKIFNYQTFDGFTYCFDTDTQEASLVEYGGEATEVVIPEFVVYGALSFKVTGLEDYCFYGCSSLTSIEIPSSVVSLGRSCFYGCSSLMSIEFSPSVTSLGEYCFYGCSSLMSIEIPSSVTSLGEGCFRGCSSLESIVVDVANPKYDSRNACNAIIDTESNTMIAGCKNTQIPLSVTILGDGCFYGCSSLSSIEIPSSVTSLGYYCFGGCSSLSSIEIPSSVTSLGYYCFEGCSSLTSIEIPSSVTSLGEGCFRGCSSLESIVVDVANPKYDSRNGCNAIIDTESNTMMAGCKNTQIPSSVTSLEYHCFEGCSSLTSIEIPSSVASLGYDCFADCSSLTSIEIPSSVARLGYYCFRGCSSLESIVVDAANPKYDSRDGCNAIIDTESNMMIAGCKNTQIPSSVTILGNGCFSDCSFLTSVDIPSSVTSVKGSCFSNCSFLESIVIPSSVSSLGGACFYGCPSLKTVICKMENVTANATLFLWTPIEDATLYVPEELIDTYKVTEPWSNFGTILPWTEELEVSVDDISELGIAFKTDNGNVMMSGFADGTLVSCYTLDGRMLGKASADGGTATFAVEPNSIVIVKAGKKSFKIYVE